jgi:hypothetical protein
MSEFQRRLALKMNAERMTVEVKVWDEMKEKHRSLKAIMDYFIAQFNEGNLQVIDQQGGPEGAAFGQYYYDFRIQNGKIELIEKTTK